MILYVSVYTSVKEEIAGNMQQFWRRTSYWTGEIVILMLDDVSVSIVYRYDIGIPET